MKTKINVQLYSWLITIPVFMFATSACVSAAPANAGPQNSIERTASYDTDDVTQIVLSIPLGELVIESQPQDKLRVEMKIECKEESNKCDKLVEDIQLEDDLDGNSLTVKPSIGSKMAYNGANAEYLIYVPDGVPLLLDFGMGEATLHNISSHLRVKMSAGEVSVSAPSDAVRNVRLDASVGDASLTKSDGTTEGKRRLLVGAKVDWQDGTGENNIDIKLGAGDISVELTE